MGGAWEWIPTFLTPCRESPPRTAVSGTHILASVSSSLPGASDYGSLIPPVYQTDYTTLSTNYQSKHQTYLSTPQISNII